MRMKSKTWVAVWLLGAVLGLALLGGAVVRVDPFFHYHAPDTARYHYTLNNERSQNYGIVRNFEYDALITGSSMTANFRTSEAETLFGQRFVKTIFPGASLKETNDLIDDALRHNPACRTVLRCLDLSKLADPWDTESTAEGVYPTWLYDEDPFNDVNYLFNRDVFFRRVLPVLVQRGREGFQPGITSFDDYSRWQETRTFGRNTVVPNGALFQPAETMEHLTEEEKAVIRENISRNVTDTADAHPGVDFYYFFPPYSIDYWNDCRNYAIFEKQLEIKAYVTELILPHRNIRLFSFDRRADIITDLNNYFDNIHYASWVNSLILKWMRNGDYRLTEENYRDVLREEADFLRTLDYESVYDQPDYEDDWYAAAMLEGELSGA